MINFGKLSYLKKFLQKNQHFLLTKRCKSEGNIDITLNDLKSKEFIKNDDKILNIIHLFKKITYNLLKDLYFGLGPKKIKNFKNVS